MGRMAVVGGTRASSGEEAGATQPCRVEAERRRFWARRRERLLELDEVERRLRPFGRRYMGVRTIPIDALIGTDGAAPARSPATSARPATCCSFSTGTAGMRSPRPAARTSRRPSSR